MDRLTVRDIPVTGKRVLVRVDFNVPLDEKTGAITDDIRIRAALPTINYLLENKARVILCSHLGRPKGLVPSLSLAPVGEYLAKLLGQPVKVARDCLGPEVEAAVNKLKEGEVLLLENLRFHPEEAKNDDAFARALAKLAEVYVNDAFGASHRAHASIVGVARYLPAVAGLLLEKEVNVLGSILKRPAHPFGVLLGGAKISDKASMLNNIMNKVDYILVGGGMASLFLKAQGYEVGNSLVEESLEVAQGITEKAARHGIEVFLPLDVVVASELNAKAESRVVPIKEIPADMRIVDIGPRTIDFFSQKLRKCRTIFWNGPMGIYELGFAQGTRALAELLAGLEAVVIIGGGSTAELVTRIGLAEKMSFVSTGGGASLEFLSGETLPGVEVLLKKGGGSGG